MWSLGCLLYEMAALKPPFIAKDIKGLKRIILAGVYPKISDYYSQDLKKAIESLLKLSPKERPSAQQFLDRLIKIDKIQNILKGPLESPLINCSS